MATPEPGAFIRAERAASTARLGVQSARSRRAAARRGDHAVAAAIVLVAAGFSNVESALAQSQPVTDSGAHASEQAEQAERLFQAAKQDLGAGRVDEACAKLEEALGLDGGSGTLLALAICHERQGRGATALREYRAARAAALRAERDDRVALADERLRALEASVSTLAIGTLAAREPGLQIELDGVELDRSEWDVPLPIDAGEHRVRALAPGRVPRDSTLRVAANNEHARVELAAWSPRPAPSAVAERSRARAVSKTEAPLGVQRVVGLSLAGVGLAALGVGSYFGLSAIHLRHEAVGECDGSPPACSNPLAVATDRRSSDAARNSTIAFGAGAAALLGGGVLFFTAPKDRSAQSARAVRIGIAPTFQGGAVSASGRF